MRRRQATLTRSPHAAALSDQDSANLPEQKAVAGKTGNSCQADRISADDKPVDQVRTVDEHLSLIQQGIAIPDPIELALLDAQGLLCAETVVADTPLPGFDNSALDGYAVRADDVSDASEVHRVTLPVVGDVPAGSRVVRTVGHGLCVRIMTGAPIPVGADTVIPAEWTDGGIARVSIKRAPQRGSFIRRVGEDVSVGDVAITPGTPIGPAQVAILAAVGRSRVLVRPRPRVVVISTGNELVPVGQKPGPSEIVDVNSYALAASARDAGALVYRAGAVPDDKRTFLETLEGCLPRADLIITSGGVNLGTFDVVKEALAELGSVAFCRVAIEPGMPQGFGTLGPHRTPIFCLPGNPVSALVACEIFVRPAIRHMMGKQRVSRRTVVATALETIDSSAGKRDYRQGLLHREPNGTYSVQPLGGFGSHHLASFAQANCLVMIEPTVTRISKGDDVTVMPLLLSNA